MRVASVGGSRPVGLSNYTYSQSTRPGCQLGFGQIFQRQELEVRWRPVSSLPSDRAAAVESPDPERDHVGGVRAAACSSRCRPPSGSRRNPARAHVAGLRSRVAAFSVRPRCRTGVTRVRLRGRSLAAGHRAAPRMNRRRGQAPPRSSGQSDPGRGYDMSARPHDTVAAANRGLSRVVLRLAERRRPRLPISRGPQRPA